MRALTERILSILDAFVPTVYRASSFSGLYPAELKSPLQMQKWCSLLSFAGQTEKTPFASFRRTYPLSHFGFRSRWSDETYMGDCLITRNGRPQGEPGSWATRMSSSFAWTTASLYAAVALLSSVARNRVPIWTPSAPLSRNRRISAWV